MKKRLVVVIICIVVLALIIASLKYDYNHNGNAVTTISGLWSAAATIVVGLIAFWQSKKYKEISDKATDALLMPDIYRMTAFSDEYNAPFEQFREYVKGRLDTNDEYRQSMPIHLGFVKGPIINLVAKSIANGDKVLSYIQTDVVSLRNEAVPFNLTLEVPAAWLAEGQKLTVTLSYENIYGTKYEKPITVSFYPDDLAVDTIEFERAKRAIY